MIILPHIIERIMVPAFCSKGAKLPADRQLLLETLVRDFFRKIHSH